MIPNCFGCSHSCLAIPQQSDTVRLGTALATTFAILSVSQLAATLALAARRSLRAKKAGDHCTSKKEASIGVAKLGTSVLVS